MADRSDSRALVRRIGIFSTLWTALLLVILFFTTRHIYCIILLGGSALSIAGLGTMIRQIDRILKTGRGKAIFFIQEIAQWSLIASGFYLAAKTSPTAALVFILGLLTLPLAFLAEGFLRLCRQLFRGT